MSEEMSNVEGSIVVHKARELVQKLVDPAFPEDKEKALQLLAEIKRLVIQDRVLKIPAIRVFLQSLLDEIRDIDATLSNDESATTEDRLILFARKKWNRDKLAQFGVENYLEDVVNQLQEGENAVDEGLQSVGEN